MQRSKPCKLDNMGKKKNTVEDIPELTPEELEKADRYQLDNWMDMAEMKADEQPTDEHGNSSSKP